MLETHLNPSQINFVVAVSGGGKTTLVQKLGSQYQKHPNLRVMDLDKISYRDQSHKWILPIDVMKLLHDTWVYTVNFYCGISDNWTEVFKLTPNLIIIGPRSVEEYLNRLKSRVLEKKNIAKPDDNNPLVLKQILLNFEEIIHGYNGPKLDLRSLSLEQIADTIYGIADRFHKKETI